MIAMANYLDAISHIYGYIAACGDDDSAHEDSSHEDSSHAISGVVDLHSAQASTNKM